MVASVVMAFPVSSELDRACRGEAGPGWELEASIDTPLSDHDEAIELLRRTSATNPDASFEHHWW